MDIIVVSDTHGFYGFIEKLVTKYPDSKFLHAGDSGLSERELYPFITVKGNCDYDPSITNSMRIVSVMGVNILMIHGHHFFLDDSFLATYAKDNNSKIIIYGHTHIPYYNYYKGVHILNPGSIVYPRVSKPTYAIIHINSIDDIKVEIKNYE